MLQAYLFLSYWVPAFHLRVLCRLRSLQLLHSRPNLVQASSLFVRDQGELEAQFALGAWAFFLDSYTKRIRCHCQLDVNSAVRFDSVFAAQGFGLVDFRMVSFSDLGSPDTDYPAYIFVVVLKGESLIFAWSTLSLQRIAVARFKRQPRKTWAPTIPTWQLV